MGKYFDNISWFMSLWQPDHSAENTMFDLMVKSMKQKSKEESPQETMTADDFFSEVKKHKKESEEKQIEYYNKKCWDEKTLIKKVQDELKASAAQGVRYIMIRCDDSTTAKANFNLVKRYLKSLGFNANNLRVDSEFYGYCGCCWYIEGPLYKC